MPCVATLFLICSVAPALPPAVLPSLFLMAWLAKALRIVPDILTAKCLRLDVIYFHCWRDEVPCRAVSAKRLMIQAAVA